MLKQKSFKLDCFNVKERKEGRKEGRQMMTEWTKGEER
jgi:hypothetical protein